MITSRKARRAGIALVAGGLLALAGCGAGAIDQADLEANISEQLAEETGEAAPDISCPGDLKAEVGATTECQLSVEGDDTTFPVAVEVTKVEDGVASYSVEVGEGEGGDVSQVDEDPIDSEPIDDEPIEEEAPTEEELPAE